VNVIFASDNPPAKFTAKVSDCPGARVTLDCTGVTVGVRYTVMETAAGGVPNSKEVVSAMDVMLTA
jgi:hypothetical protein